MRHDAEERIASKGPKVSSEEFWQAAYDFDPFAATSPPGPKSLESILQSGQMRLVHLGKLYGKIPLMLLPAMGALPDHPEPNDKIPFKFAATDSGAISYPDGHPKEAIPVSDLDKLSVSVQSSKDVTVKPSEDDKLRRFASLGWVMQKRLGEWTKTGHVLVMDIDDKQRRHRQPWLVLAAEWPTDSYKTQEGEFEHRAPREVPRPDKTAFGVFPGDDNRTPLCSIVPRGNDKSKIPTLKRFAEDFEFDPIRLGGHRRAVPGEEGPALAHVMPWYWDPQCEREVCFTQENRIYMMYDRAADMYTFPDFASLKIEG